MLNFAFLIFVCLWFYVDGVVSSQKIQNFKSLFSNHSILAFGDSLTVGSLGLPRTKLKHPYIKHVQMLINDTSIQVLEAGLSGERTDRMIERLPKYITTLTKHKLKLALILGGTNDICQGYYARDIFKNLVNLHQQILSLYSDTSTITIAIGIPQLNSTILYAKEIKHINESARLEVNNELVKFAQSSNNRVHYVSLDSVVDQTDPLKRNELWNIDLIHFTAKGYDAIGRFLFDEIVQISNKLSQ